MFSIGEELDRFRREVLKLKTKKKQSGRTPRNGSATTPETKPRIKACTGPCGRVLPCDTVYFAETIGGNLGGKCRRCQRTT